MLAEGRLPQHLTAMEMLSGLVHVLLPAAELPARPCSLRAGFPQAPSLLPLRWVPTGSLLSCCLASPCTAARRAQSRSSSAHTSAFRGLCLLTYFSTSRVSTRATKLLGT